MRLGGSLHGLRARLAILVLGLVLAGCAGLSGLPQQPLRLSLADIGIEEIGLLEQKLRLSLRVQNPNNAVVVVQGVDYVLELNDRKFAEGLSGQRVELPRFGETVVQVSAISGLVGVLRQWRDLQTGTRDALAYRISGRLTLDGGRSIPFEHRGEVPLPSLFGR